MLFPRGEVSHSNLSTAYTDFPALISTLRTGDFSGIVEIEFPENRGVIFVDSGETINAEAKTGADSNRLLGREAIQALLTLSNRKDGVINIYRLPPEQVAIVASNLQHEILFKELSTDFTSLDRLLLKLKEDKHHGFIEVLTKEHRAMGVLFLEEGELVEMFTIPESGPSAFGRKSIALFVENVINKGAILNVYRSRATQEKKVTGGEDPKEIIPILEDVLTKAERLVDESTRKKGLFLKLFKESLIQKSDEFPFLDPFSGEFEFQEGRIRFAGDIGLRNLAKGIVECVRAIPSYIEKELPKDKVLPLKLRAGTESSLKNHSDALRRLGIDAVHP